MSSESAWLGRGGIVGGDRSEVLLRVNTGAEQWSHKSHFAIDLLPAETPIEGIESQMVNGKSMREEYATRYLEQIGAKATPKTVQLVKDQLPLDISMITSA